MKHRTSRGSLESNVDFDRHSYVGWGTRQMKRRSGAPHPEQVVPNTLLQYAPGVHPFGVDPHFGPKAWAYRRGDRRVGGQVAPTGIGST